MKFLNRTEIIPWAKIVKRHGEESWLRYGNAICTVGATSGSWAQQWPWWEGRRWSCWMSHRPAWTRRPGDSCGTCCHRCGPAAGPSSSLLIGQDFFPFCFLFYPYELHMDHCNQSCSANQPASWPFYITKTLVIIISKLFDIYFNTCHAYSHHWLPPLYTSFSDLDWVSQGQCKAKPLHFIFSHTLLMMKFDMKIKFVHCHNLLICWSLCWLLRDWF